MGKNVLVGGVLIHQTRRDRRSCGAAANSPRDAQDWWHQGAARAPICNALSTAPFGVDPQFSPGSRLFVPGLNASEFYEPDEVNSRGVPMGFFSRPMRGYPPGFPVLIHSEESANKALFDTVFLTEGSFIDDDTVQARHAPTTDPDAVSASRATRLA